MTVYAGLIPPDARLLGAVTQADLAMFMFTWSASLLSNAMFALPYTKLDGCPPYTCRGVILPGAIGLARRYGPALNESIYSGDTFVNSTAVRVLNAPGMVVRYDVPAAEDLVFDMAKHCVYTGEQVDNGLQICFRQDGDSLLAAWSACTKPIYDAYACNLPSPSTAPWRLTPFVSGTRLSLYRIATSTTYDRSTQAILDIDTHSAVPSQIPLNASHYAAIFARALIPPTPTSTSARPTGTPKSRTSSPRDDATNAHALLYLISWTHRTNAKTFPDDHHSPVAHLQNLLAVPVQFAVTAAVFGNYSLAERGFGGGVAVLPEAMATEARGGRASDKLVVERWAAGVFLGVEGAVHAVVVGWIIWMLVIGRRNGGGGRELETGLVGVDEVRAARRGRVLKGRDSWLGEWLGGRRRGLGMARRDGGEEKGKVPEEMGLMEFYDMQDVAEGEFWPYIMARRNRGVRVIEGR
ncbi:hypothetical protein QBC39DRAFT_365651 [Podospora conica]|nr:hypothetical protein QBC39DRAFT_365651 [Schizothecium conicum]